MRHIIKYHKIPILTSELTLYFLFKHLGVLVYVVGEVYRRILRHLHTADRRLQTADVLTNIVFLFPLPRDNEP